MAKTNSREVLQWHPVFFAGIQIELEEEKENLIFENEHQLTKKPLGIDVLIIKKNKDIPVKKSIGRMFRKHNIIEYKSPADYLSIDDFYKALAYAYLYKTDGDYVDQIKIEDITVTLVCHKFPYKLMKHLREHYNDEIERREKGIYVVKGEKLPVQIILVSRLSEEENLWIRCLHDPVRKVKTVEKIAEIYKKRGKSSLYEAVMDFIIRVNKNTFKKENAMCKALEELFYEINGERLEKEIEAKVAEELKVNECKAKAGCVLDLLEDYGKIPEELQVKILAEQDFAVLKRWLRLAAKSTSVETFQMAM